jgi:DNA-binding response OmpR family regulator
MTVRKVLVVERDPQRAGAIDLYLRGRGLRVFLATGGSQAIRVAAAERIDAALIGRAADVPARALAASLRMMSGPLVVLHAGDVHPATLLERLRAAARTAA